MVPYRRLLAIGILLIVSTGYAVSSCGASLVSVAESHLNDASSSATPVKNPARDPAPPKQFDVPSHGTMMDTSMSGSPSVSSGSNGATLLNGNNGFKLLVLSTDMVYLLSWMWLPCPPDDDLLKVPITAGPGKQFK